MTGGSDSNCRPGQFPTAVDTSELGATTESLQQRLMLDLIGDVTGKHVLDAGCGDGSFAVELARRGARVTAVDASQAMVDAARHRAAGAGVGVGVDFHVATIQTLPFPAARFDLVIAFTVLCFVKDAAPVFAEIFRVLRLGGRLVIGELGKWSTWAAERRVRAWFGSALWRLGRFRTPHELRSLAANAGLEPSVVTGAIYYPRSALAARWMKDVDSRLGRLSTFGAAFLALAATKPVARV